MFEAEPSAAPQAHRVGNANANGGTSALSVHAPQQAVFRTASAPSQPPTRQLAQDDRVTALCAKVDELSTEVQTLRAELRAFLAAQSSAPHPPPDAKPAPSPALCPRCACETNGAPLESTRDSHYLSAADGDAERPLSPPAAPLAPLAFGEEAAADTFV